MNKAKQVFDSISMHRKNVWRKMRKQLISDDAVTHIKLISRCCWVRQQIVSTFRTDIQLSKMDSNYHYIFLSATYLTGLGRRREAKHSYLLICNGKALLATSIECIPARRTVYISNFNRITPFSVCLWLVSHLIEFYSLRAAVGVMAWQR